MNARMLSIGRSFDVSGSKEIHVSTIATVRSGFYHVPLPIALTDSTHGEMKYFELITVRLVDSDGAEGTGYSYTVGAGGGGIHDMLVRDLTPRLLGQRAEN